MVAYFLQVERTGRKLYHLFSRPRPQFATDYRMIILRSEPFKNCAYEVTFCGSAALVCNGEIRYLGLKLL